MNRKTTLILVIVLAVLGLFTWWLQTSPQGKAASATPTPTVVASNPLWEGVTSDQVSGLQVTDNISGTSVVVTKDSLGVWNVVKPEARMADSNTITSLLGTFTTLAVMTDITSTTDLAPFGLITPTYGLQADLANGASLKISIGDKIPTGTGYYVLRAGDAKPKVVADYGLQPFIDLLNKPPYFVPTPTVTPTISSGAPALLTATPTP